MANFYIMSKNMKCRVLEHPHCAFVLREVGAEVRDPRETAGQICWAPQVDRLTFPFLTPRCLLLRVAVILSWALPNVCAAYPFTERVAELQTSALYCSDRRLFHPSDS